MARFGTEGRAFENTANVTPIGADFGRIVARFWNKRKPDPAWKSRLFNNLDGSRRRTAALVHRRRTACLAYRPGRRPCGGPQGYDSHSPRHNISAPFERI